MRIAFLTTEFPNRYFFAGGLATYLRRTAEELARRGHFVEVFTLSPRSGRVVNGKVVVQEVASAAPRLRLLRQAYLLNTIDSCRLFARFLKSNRGRRFDVVQAANNKACGLAAARIRIAPLVTRVSSYQRSLRQADGARNTTQLLRRERLEYWQRECSTAVYAPSNRTAREIMGAEGSIVDTIEPPFDAAEVAGNCRMGAPPFAGERYGLYFGRLEYLKGCDRLLEVLPKLLRADRRMCFAFVGAPGQFPGGRTFDQLSATLLSEFPGRVAVMPPMRHDHLLPVVRGAGFVVLPSRTENLCNACLEAMALGRVVVATRDASFEQLITHGKTGFLVPQDDNAELERTLRTVWTMNAAEREDVGAAAHQALERLHPDLTIPNLLDYFERVIARRPGRGGAVHAANPFGRS